MTFLVFLLPDNVLFKMLLQLKLLDHNLTLSFESVFSILSVLFAVYTIEAFLKIVGLGLKKYFLSGWNV